jgi:hypothetical protein
MAIAVMRAALEKMPESVVEKFLVNKITEPPVSGAAAVKDGIG